MTACSTPPPSGARAGDARGRDGPGRVRVRGCVASRDLRAWGPVYDALVEEVDEELLRNLPLVLDTAVDVAEVRDAYDSELVGVRGWDAMPEQPTVDEAWAQGWTSPDGQDALVLVGLEPRTGETHVPLTVLTTLPDEEAG